MSRTLRLNDNDLTSLLAGVFDAPTSFLYVHGWGRAEMGDAATHARVLPRICGMDMSTYGSMCVVGGTHARGRPRPDGTMIVCPGISTFTTTT